MPAYYNEIDPYAAQWLRNLIAAGHIAPGDVDERSIEDVSPDDLAGYEQCHFFAGIGGWSLALQLAGWPDDQPVWTGSCPCQPLSCAGQRQGHADRRHLWPAFFRLIAECRPATIFGEQVASTLGREWLAGVRADLEHLGYACGAADLPAASVGAPHIRQRLWWVADASHERRQQITRSASRDEGTNGRRTNGHHILAGDGEDGGLGLTDRAGRVARLTPSEASRHRHTVEPTGSDVGLADAGHGYRPAWSSRRQQESEASIVSGSPGGREDGGLGIADGAGHEIGIRLTGNDGAPPESTDGQAALEAGAWGEYEFTLCADGKARRIEPGIQPLAARFSDYLVALRTIESRAWAAIGTYGPPQGNPDEILRMVRDAVQSEVYRREAPPVGMCRELHQTSVLLDFLLCLEAARDGASNGGGWSKAGDEAQQRVLRSLRNHGRDMCPSHRREPEEQCACEPPDALLALSRVLARDAEAYRSALFDAHAASCRIGALRGAGNAIVPQVAAVFIAAARDVT